MLQIWYVFFDALVTVLILSCQKAKFLGLVTAGMALASIGLAANPAKALTTFSGQYAPSNWTQSIQGDGSIITGGAPANIVLTSADDGGGDQSTDFTITALSAGTVSFDWNYILPTNSSYGSEWDPFGYLLNGTFTKLTVDGPSLSQSGSTSFSVNAGDVFGFRQNSVDSTDGSASTTVSNFNVPGPLPILGIPAVLLYSRNLKKRIKARRETSGASLS